MLSRVSRNGVVTWILLATAGAALAGPVPGRWEKVEALPPGTEVLVTLQWGNRKEGEFLGLEAEVLRLRNPAGRETELLRTDVARVEKAAREGRAGRGARNGAIIASLRERFSGIRLAALISPAGWRHRKRRVETSSVSRS